jgi:hypothetical protein
VVGWHLIELSHLICDETICSHEVEPIEADSVEMDDGWVFGGAVQFILSSR